MVLSFQTVDRPKDWYKTMFKQIHMVHKPGMYVVVLWWDPCRLKDACVYSSSVQFWFTENIESLANVMVSLSLSMFLFVLLTTPSKNRRLHSCPSLSCQEGPQEVTLEGSQALVHPFVLHSPWSMPMWCVLGLHRLVISLSTHLLLISMVSLGRSR